MATQAIKSADYSLGSIADSPIKDVLLRATLAMKAEDFQAASRVLTSAIQANPQQPDFMLLDLRAACNLHLNLAEQALDDSMLCTKLNPGWARGWARVGTAQLALGHYRASVSAYKKAIELDGGSGTPEMQLGLELAGQALMGQGDRRAAMHE